MRRTKWLGLLATAMAVVPRVEAEAPCGVEYIYAGSRLLATYSPPGGAATLSVATVATVNENLSVPPSIGFRPSITLTTSDTCALPVDVSVSYSTEDGSALAGQDYVAQSGSVTFPRGTLSGATLKGPTIGMQNDTVPEPEETFKFKLFGASGAVIGNGEMVVTILDDDAPRVSLFLDQEAADAVIREDGVPVVGPVKARVTTPDSSALTEALTVPLGVGPGGSATAGADFTLPAAVQFPQGTTSGTEVEVGATPLEDLILEGDEAFVLTLSPWLGGSGLYSLGSASMTVTIQDDDVSPPLSLYTIPPCRVFDSGSPPTGGLAPGEDRTIPVTGLCAIPPVSATPTVVLGPRAIALTVTVVSPTADGHLRIHPNGTVPGPASVVNYSAGGTIASNGHFFLDPAGTLNIYCFQASGTTPTRVLIDVTGYFQ